jgi:hypothetical protein
MSRNNKKATIETATPVSNIEAVVVDVPQGTEAPKALVIVSTPKPTLQIVKETGAKASTTPEEAIPESIMEELKVANLNTVNKVKSLYATGYSRKQIVAAGFNSSTVYRQVGEYIKAMEAKKLAEATPEVSITEEVAI